MRILYAEIFPKCGMLCVAVRVDRHLKIWTCGKTVLFAVGRVIIVCAVHLKTSGMIIQVVW